MSKILKQAFTLIELLVVIAIIGILSGLIVVAMGGMTEKANIAKAQVFSNSLRNSLMLNLVSEWRFDEIITTATSVVPDSWNGGSDGVLKENNYAGACDLTHCPQLKTTDCISGKCFIFDGINDYIDYGTRANLNFTNVDSFTFSLWAKNNGTTVANGSVAGLLIRDYSGGGYGIDFYPYSNMIRAGIRNVSNGSQTVDYVLSDNLSNWTQIVLTYAPNDLQGIKLYTNGVFRLSRTTVGFSAFSSANHLLTGYGILGGSGVYFNGLIDDARIYNATVPASQVQEQYYAGLNKMLNGGTISKKDYIEKIIQMAKNE